MPPASVEMSDPRVGQDYVMRTYLVPAYDPEKPEQSAALDLLAHILGSGTGSRLAQSLQIEQGIAIDSGAWYSPAVAQTTTTFGVYGVPAEGQTLDEVEAGIDAELARIADTGPTEDELARAKQVTRASRIFAEDSQSGPGAPLRRGAGHGLRRRGRAELAGGDRPRDGRAGAPGGAEPEAREVGDGPPDPRRSEELMTMRTLYSAPGPDRRGGAGPAADGAARRRRRSTSSS